MTKDTLPSPPPWDGVPAAEPKLPRGRDAHSAAAVDTLKQAMRRARADNAERAGIICDLRAARLGRLELLLEALKPLVAQIPAEVDTFDVALVAGGNPRLFVDMIGFVEMGRDPRLYRLLQDTRTGRTVLKESERIDTMVEAITDYVARRLLEREKALAADTPPVSRAPGPARSAPAPHDEAALPDEPSRARARPFRPVSLVVVAFSFLIDLLGSLALFTALTVGLWYAWTRLHPGS